MKIRKRKKILGLIILLLMLLLIIYLAKLFIIGTQYNLEAKKDAFDKTIKEYRGRNRVE